MYGSNGQGSTTHVCMELFNGLAGLDMVHVPYKGSVFTLTDIMSGRIQVTCQPLPNLTQFEKTGRVRTLAVTTSKQTRLAPGVPTAGETLPGFDVVGWQGMVAPLKTPRHILENVSAALAKIVLAPEMQERLRAQSVEPAPSSPSDFAAHLEAETSKWLKVLKDANIRPE